MRSTQYEQVLNRQGVTWKYLERLDLKAVDSKLSLKNQARLLEPEDKELQEQYADLYKEGSQGPPIVVYERNSGGKRTFIIIDGNQRTAAARKAGLDTLDAYVVDSKDDMVLDDLTWSWNNLVNGKRLTREESIEHAVTMVEKYSISMKEAARRYGVPWRAVQTRITANKARSVLRERAAPQAASGLSDPKLESLYSFATIGEDVFTIAATTAHRCGLVESDIRDLKREVDKAKTHEDKVKAVVEFSESDLAKQRKAETKGGTCRTSPQSLLPSERLLKKLREVLYLFESNDTDALRRRGVGYKELRKVSREVADYLVLTFGLGARPARNGEDRDEDTKGSSQGVG